jgi:DNA-binding IclR family transcriptional regulator
MTAASTSRVPVQRARREDVDGGVKSVMAALDVLECFADDDEIGVSDIARRLGVAKSTVHRLLTTLCARGLAEKNPETGMYRLGLHLFELGALAQDRMRLRKAALPLLEELRQISGCTIHLAVPEGADAVYVERLETLHGLRLMTSVGRRWPSHATASGKVMAAYNPDYAAARKASGFPAQTMKTISTASQYDRTLAEIRRLGVAVSNGEAQVGLASVAAPVLDGFGRARAAISLVGPAHELGEVVGRRARLLTVASRNLSKSLAL